MDGAVRYACFLAYLLLFVFVMRVLVLANNLLLLYVGWEGVGLCSYLLIGHWFERPAAASAAKKAFVVTRVGDAAMLVGLALVFVAFGSLDFQGTLAHAASGSVARGTVTVLAFPLLAGAAADVAPI